MHLSERGQYLHDRTTRGILLTTDEQAELALWYAEQDHAERVLLQGAVGEANTSLQQKVNATLDQIRIVTQHIQELSAENDALRHENAELRRHLAHKSASQAV